MLKFNNRKIAAVLFAAVIVFSLSGAFVVIADKGFGRDHLYGFAQLMDLSREGKLAQTFASLLLLFAAALAAIAAQDASRRNIGSRALWILLSILLLLVGIDETAAVRERIIPDFRDHVGLENVGMFHYAWTIPAIVLLAALSPLMLRLVRSLEPRVRFLVMLSACLYIGGALGVELIDGYYASLYGEKTLVYGLMTVVEESLELAGAALFDYAMLVHLSRSHARLEVSFT